jgi:hypothetical protein
MVLTTKLKPPDVSNDIKSNIGSHIGSTVNPVWSVADYHGKVECDI